MSNTIQLFLLPFAGGSSISFKKLLPFLDKRIVAKTIEYAGRLKRKDEGFIKQYDEFLDDVANQINQCLDINSNYALFGYSLGSILAYELVAQKKLIGKISHIFLCAKGSPFYTPLDDDPVDYSSDSFIKEIFNLGGVDERIMSDKRFLDAYMRPIRADYIIWSQYRYRGGRIPCSATAIYSKMDEAAVGVGEWQAVTDKTVDFFDMGNSHFFINDYLKEVADIVNSHLNIYLDIK